MKEIIYMEPTKGRDLSLMTCSFCSQNVSKIGNDISVNSWLEESSKTKLRSWLLT